MEKFLRISKICFYSVNIPKVIYLYKVGLFIANILQVHFYANEECRTDYV